MNKMVFKSVMDGYETYIRVSKAYARKNYKTERIDMCPVNVRPGGGFRPNMMIPQNGDRTFDQWIDEFTYYNCTNEVGYYPAFYKVTLKELVK